MMKIYSYIILLFSVTSCKLQPDSDRSYDTDASKIYKIGLNPAIGSSYSYNISNETEMILDLDGKEVQNLNKSDVAARYAIGRDSAGDFLLTINYDKVNLHTKAGETENDYESGNATSSIDPVEKMLGMLKDATITVTLNPSGEVRQASGYKELEEKIISGMNATDESSRNIARQQWERVVGDGIVRKNMDQFFRIFPDSAVHIGDDWKINSLQSGDLPMNLKTTYTLKKIDDDVAFISSAGKVKTQEGANMIMGYANVEVEIEGTQDGEFKVETKTGMLIGASIVSKIMGTIKMMGREIPLSINSSVEIEGKRAK